MSPGSPVQGCWLPELRKLVGDINAHFGESFARIGCVGEVALHESEDYERFAIQVGNGVRVCRTAYTGLRVGQAGGQRGQGVPHSVRRA
jgi:hypothetical protein